MIFFFIYNYLIKIILNNNNVISSNNSIISIFNFITDDILNSTINHLNNGIWSIINIYKKIMNF